MSKLKITKKMATVALGVMGLAGYNAYAVDVTVGGNIQIVNILNASGQLGLDFTSSADDIEVANFTITNNTTSFDLALTFANNGDFTSAVTAQTVTPTYWGFLLTNHATAAGTGVLDVDETVDAGGTPFVVNGDITDEVQAGAATWNPADQTTATSGLVASLIADWAASTNLAGLYTETITATLTATP